MERDNRDRSDFGRNQHHNQHHQSHQYHAPDWDSGDRYWDDRHQHPLHSAQFDRFGQGYGRPEPQHPSHSPNSYRHDQQDRRRPYQENYSQDQDRFGETYQQDFRHDPTLPRGGQDDDRLGNIRQGYGISSYDGTSDRFNTLNSEHRYGYRQDEQAYYSGDRDGYNRSQLGGGLGESGLHSDRGIPDYGTHSFQDPYGAGLGSTYGGTNYGGGTGYTGGHQGGTWGHNTYGTSSGNLIGYGPMGDSTYGSGQGSSGGTSSQNSGRGSGELGGF
ncbi:hypothetical protein ACFSC6_20090 [Rufibacter sediminis]|uniref:Uncharacterized protein n=1 Tax=Rufibacter sediminis TaxID=2762756 RepID=A0ABR6VNN3_9BACT|nr:hypothetical protein [Rufibacter sediminis]MBC3538750.1 hypothetical protein [Rufibacter sediminis]